MMPIATTTSLNCASSEATIRSIGQQSISPPEMQRPCTAAIVGFGMFRQRSQKPR